MLQLHSLFALALCLPLPAAAHAEAKTAAFWVSGPVEPGGTVMVTGQFLLNADVSIRVAALIGNNMDWHALVDFGAIVPALKKTEHVVMFELPKGKDSVYGFRLEQSGERPIYGRVNLPEVWWTLSQAPSDIPGVLGHTTHGSGVANGTLQIFGRNLAHAGGADKVVLTPNSGKSRTVPARMEGPYALSANLPPDLENGVYKLVVSGSVGDTKTSSRPVTFEIREQRPTGFRTINVQSYGGVGDGLYDNSPVFAQVLAKAAEAAPAKVFIPNGLYLLSKPLQIPPDVYLVGSSRESTALYFADTKSPPPAWIEGSRSFGLANLSVFCGNHRAIVSSNMLGDIESSGHIVLEKVSIRGDAFSGHITAPEEGARSAAILQNWGYGFETVRLSGPDISVVDCDLLGSGRSLVLFRANGAILTHNKFYNGRFGSYSMGGSEEVCFCDNRIEGSDLSSSGGSYSVPRGGYVSRNIYTANNSFERFRGWDSESFTSDGGGGAYYGPASSTGSSSIDLKYEPKWSTDDWKGTLVAITSGRGLGQWRTVASWDDKHVELSEPFDIAPDDTSVLTIVPLQCHYTFYKNNFSDAGVAVQLYGTGVEQVVAENESKHAGGFRVWSLSYFDGVQPQIDVQLIGNTVSGFAYANLQPDLRPGVQPSVIDAESHKPAAIIGLVIRDNFVGEGCLLTVSSWGRAGIKTFSLNIIKSVTLEAPYELTRALPRRCC